MSLSFAHKGRFFFWVCQALIKKYRRLLGFVFLGSLVLFLFIFSLLPLLKSIFNRPPPLKIGMVGNFTPQNFPLEIQNLLSLGLTKLTATGEATASAAQSWETGEEGKVYIFHLNQNLFWQDGEKFTVADINYNFKDTATEIADETTLRFRLKEPFSPFLTLVSQPLFKKGLVGLGDHRVENLEMEGEFISQLVISGKGKRRIYKFYPSEKAAILAFKLGEINVIEGITNISDFEGWPVKITPQLVYSRLVVIFFNTKDSLLGEKGVRQALNYALPESAEETRARSPLSPSSWAYNEQVKVYPPSLEMAKKVLEKTKVGTSSAQRKITLTTLSPQKSLAEKIKDGWEKLGFATEVKIEEALPLQFQALLAFQEIPPDPDQYQLWHSTQKETNITQYQNPRIDKLLEDGRRLQKKEERLPKYLDFQKYLVDDTPATFLYHPKIYTVSHK